MRIIKSADPVVVAAEMIAIERGCEYTRADGTTIIIQATAGTIYLPLYTNLADFCGRLDDELARARAWPRPLSHPCARAGTAFTAVFAAPASFSRQIVVVGGPAAAAAAFTWTLEHIDQAVAAIYTADENLRRNLAAILCDSDSICTLTGPHLTVSAADFVGSQLNSGDTVILSRSGLSPVLLNTDTYWRQRPHNAQVRGDVKSISESDVPSTVPVIGLDGDGLPGDDYCACCTRALAAETYFIPSSAYGCINLCQLCFCYDSTIRFKTAYKYNRDYRFLVTTQLLVELTNVRECGPAVLIGDTYMHVDSRRLLFTPISKSLPGRKNVNVEWWD